MTISQRLKLEKLPKKKQYELLKRLQEKQAQKGKKIL